MPFIQTVQSLLPSDCVVAVAVIVNVPSVTVHVHVLLLWTGGTLRRIAMYGEVTVAFRLAISDLVFTAYVSVEFVLGPFKVSVGNVGGVDD